jgi:hypothetical protein
MKKKWKRFIEIHEMLVEREGDDDEAMIGPYVAM